MVIEKKQPLTPSEFSSRVRQALIEKFSHVMIQGEVSEFRIVQSKFVYFRLKDQETSIQCFCMKWDYEKTGISLIDGMEIVIRATASLFRKTSQLHLRVTDIVPIGEGALKKAFEALKQKLTREGLFAVERKRPIPRFPSSIAVITSPDAAAWTDIQRVLTNRMTGLSISLLPVSVQGIGAPKEIEAAFEWLNERVSDFDVVLLARGGGSLEDLWAFNDERVVRAVFASKVPVVVGVGHERDETLSDYAADLRASTPSNAAERVVCAKGEVMRMILGKIDRMEHCLLFLCASQKHATGDLLHRIIASVQRRVERVKRILFTFFLYQEKFRSTVQKLSSRIRSVEQFLQSSMTGRVHEIKTALLAHERILTSLHPHRLLSRGYSITSDRDGKVITDAASCRASDDIETQFAAGRARSTIFKITHESKTN